MSLFPSSLSALLTDSSPSPLSSPGWVFSWVFFSMSRYDEPPPHPHLRAGRAHRAPQGQRQPEALAGIRGERDRGPQVKGHCCRAFDFCLIAFSLPVCGVLSPPPTPACSPSGKLSLSIPSSLRLDLRGHASPASFSEMSICFCWNSEKPTETPARALLFHLSPQGVPHDHGGGGGVSSGLEHPLQVNQ